MDKVERFLDEWNRFVEGSDEFIRVRREVLDSQEMDDDSRADWLMLGHALENMLNTARQLFHKEATGIPVLAIMAASFCLTVGFAGDKLPMMMLHRIVTDFIDMKPEHRMKVINYARAFVIRSPS